MVLDAGVHEVAVDGGRLAVEVRSGSSEPVLAVHGISSNRRLWGWLHAAAPELTLVAPDLRGRADSVDVAGPSSIAQHAHDLVAVLDALGLDAVHVVGMSMGGFVAVELAVEHPERVRSLVLVDGGLPMAAPAGLTHDGVRTLFADRLARLDQRWDSVEEYTAFLTSTTAPLLDPADPLLLAAQGHDLHEGRVRLSGDALVDDAAGVFLAPSRWREVTVPVRLLHAEWSTGAGSAPAYPAAVVEAARPHLASATFLPGLDHAGSIMTATGASAVAEVVAEALRG